MGFEKLHSSDRIDIDHSREQFVKNALPHFDDGLRIVLNAVQLQ